MTPDEFETIEDALEIVVEDLRLWKSNPPRDRMLLGATVRQLRDCANRLEAYKASIKEAEPYTR